MSFGSFREVFSPGSFSGDVNLSPKKTMLPNEVSG